MAGLDGQLNDRADTVCVTACDVHVAGGVPPHSILGMLSRARGDCHPPEANAPSDPQLRFRPPASGPATAESCSDITQSATHAVATAVPVSRPHPRSFTASRSPLERVAASHETCDAALGAPAESKRSTGSSPRIPRRMTIDDQLAGAVVLLVVIGCVALTVWRVI